MARVQSDINQAEVLVSILVFRKWLHRRRRQQAGLSAKQRRRIRRRIATDNAIAQPLER
jgi:hypothetical protein